MLTQLRNITANFRMHAARFIRRSNKYVLRINGGTQHNSNNACEIVGGNEIDSNNIDSNNGSNIVNNIGDNNNENGGVIVDGHGTVGSNVSVGSANGAGGPLQSITGQDACSCTPM